MEEKKKYPSLPSNYVSILDLKQLWLKQQKQQQDEEDDEAKQKQQQNGIDNQQQRRQVVENSYNNGGGVGDRENHHHRKVYDRRAAKDVGKEQVVAVTDSIDFLHVNSHHLNVHDRRRDVVAEKDVGKRQAVVEKHSGDREKKKMRDESMTGSIDSLHAKKKNPPRKVYDRRRRDIVPEKCDGEDDEALKGKSEVKNGAKRWIEKKHVDVEINNGDAYRRSRSHWSDVTSRVKPEKVAVVVAEVDGETESGAEILNGDDGKSDVVKKIQKSHSYKMKKKMIGDNSLAPASIEGTPLASVEGQIKDETYSSQALISNREGNLPSDTKNKNRKKKQRKNPYLAKNEREKKDLIGDILPVTEIMPEKKKSDWTSENNINLLMNMSRKIREPQIEQKFVHLTVNDNNGETGNEANSRPYKNGVVYGHVHSSTRFSQSRNRKESLVWVKKD